MATPHRDVSWDEFHLTTYKLAQKLKGREYAGLIVLTRGGLAPTRVIAEELKLKIIETLCIESYRSGGERENLQSGLVVHKGLGAEFLALVHGKRILVVDEVCDTGKTAVFVRDTFTKMNLAFDIATPYVKPAGKPHVDFFEEEVVDQDIWIDFPWEVLPRLLQSAT